METDTSNTQNTSGHSRCSKRDALWLCWFAGLFGAHRDLAGRKGGGCLFLLCWLAALVCLVLCPPVFFLWLAFCIIWWLVDLFTLIAGKYRDGDGRLLYTTDTGHYSSADVYTTLASPFGIHRFYARQTGSATVMLIVSLLAVVIVIAERILRAIIKTLLIFTDSDATEAGAGGLSTLGTIVGGFFLLPLLKAYEALFVFMIIGYIGYIVMAIWAFVDFIRGLFGKVENGYGNIMLEDQEELYQARLKDWNACMGIAAPSPAALPTTPPALPKAAQAPQPGPAEEVPPAVQPKPSFQPQSPQLHSKGWGAGAVVALLMALFLLVGGVGYYLYNMVNPEAHHELTLEVQPKMGDYGQTVPPCEEDMQQACNILRERLRSGGIRTGKIRHSGNRIIVLLPKLDEDAGKEEEKLDSLAQMLTQPSKLELLAVYPEQDRVLANPEVQDSIAQYEQRMGHYNSLSEDEQKRTRKPALPRIPSRLDLRDYQILPGPVTNDETGEPELDKYGKQKVYYYVLQKPYVAMQKDVYITGAEVSEAQPDHARKGYVDVVLNRTGAERMGKLTGSMQIGRDRIAVVLNGQVKCAPVVQAVLHKDFNISGLNGKGEPENIASALANPLSSDLKVVGRRNVSTEPPRVGGE